MTRDEQMWEAVAQEHGDLSMRDALVTLTAMEWTDKTMIEKARQWFNLHFRQVGTPREIKHDFESKERMWKSFTQFMEE